MPLFYLIWDYMKSKIGNRLDKLEKAKKEGKILRIRTIKPNKDTYIHIGVTKKEGRRGGRTIAGKVRHVKKE
jgi:hypothetical protein